MVFFSSQHTATTYHCSNSPLSLKEWPSSKVMGFGNSPPDTPLRKVENGKLHFQEIIEETGVQQKETLVKDLMQLLSRRER